MMEHLFQETNIAKNEAGNGIQIQKLFAKRAASQISIQPMNHSNSQISIEASSQ